MLVPVYFISGLKIGDMTFNGTPLVGDVFLVSFTDGDLKLVDILAVVVSRRWTKDGNLELIVGYYE